MTNDEIKVLHVVGKFRGSLPEGGTPGQILEKTETGAEWKDNSSADGHTPYIGENGNWWINGVDTGEPSRGVHHVDIDCEGGDKTILVENSTVYRITNCAELTMTFPEDSPLPEAHIFVSFAEDSNAAVVFPDGISYYGTDPLSVDPGDNWEISIDPVGGMLFLGKKV